MTTVRDYDKSIHSNPDAQAWAKFFIETVKEQGWKIEHISEGLMIGWFANAMMAMHDHIKREWVGLTDEELRQAYCEVSGKEWCLGGMSNAHTFYEVIEAKLKEKNT